MNCLEQARESYWNEQTKYQIANITIKSIFKVICLIAKERIAVFDGKCGINNCGINNLGGW